MIINLVLFFIPKRQEIYRLYLIKKRKKLAYMMLNSKTRIKLIDVNMTINDKTATIKYNISDTAIGLLLISGNIGRGVFFSIVINYGTKYSIKLLSFNASNTNTSSIAINTDLGKITFNGNSKLESFYKVNGLLFG